MNYRSTRTRPPFLLAFALLLLLLPVEGCNSQTRPLFQSSEMDLDSFNFAVGANVFTLNTRGILTRDRRSSQVQLEDLPAGFLVTRAAFDTVSSDLLIVFEITDYETATIVLTRVQRPSMKQAWRIGIPALSFGPMLLDTDQRTLYVTATGVVGAVDLQSGTVLWIHDDLYTSDGHFGAFEVPVLHGDLVDFVEVPPSGAARQVRISKRTGGIL